ncbi:MAG TPA: cardiolipin synthase B, partial [Elusimicrobiales bacterium]|nr:cardiolipin synthase B [Elusimicrobiales bacterium]
GVRVRLIYDSVGSMDTSWSFFDKLHSAGALAAEYNPVMPWTLHRLWGRRDHRKTLIIDSKTCFAGGLNISAEYGPASWGGAAWRDTAVQVSGPCVGELIKLFWETWAKCAPPDRKLAAAMRREKEDSGEIPASISAISGFRSRRSFAANYRYAIEQASDYIYLTNAYFVPGRRVTRGLMRAARRGVRVAVIVPSQADVPFVRTASWALYATLLRAGVEIYEWLPGILHAKTCVVDGNWSSVGSHNFDYRSLRYNEEVNINVYGRKFGAELVRMFEEDLKNCRRVHLEEWSRKSLGFRLTARLLYLLRGAL